MPTNYPASGPPRVPPTLPITVAELVALLQQQPQHLFVSMEGCDCYGLAGSVGLADYEVPTQYVYIYRADEQ